jgi:hypothetical protein
MIGRFVFIMVGYFVLTGLVMAVFFTVPALQTDAVMPFAIVSMVLLLGVPPFFFGRVFRGSDKRDREILLNGYPGKATIVGLQDTGWTVNDNPMIKMTLDIQPEVGAAFRVEVKAMVSRLAIPKVGDTFPVKYDPNDPGKVVIVPPEATQAEQVPTQDAQNW